MTRPFSSFSLEMQSEAKKWKDRGNQLFKAKEFEVVTQFYAMAIAHCPTLGSEELMSVLLSNRSLALSQLGKQDEALDDAQRCISVRPEWFKVNTGYYILLVTIVHRFVNRSAVRNPNKQAVALVAESIWGSSLQLNYK